MSDRPLTEDLLSGCSRDGILRGRLSLWQPRKGYRFSVDAPLLAHFASQGREAQEGYGADLGAGCGVVGLLFASFCPRWRLTLVELGSRLAALALVNARDNGFGRRVEVMEGDLRHIGERLGQGAVDLVMANPPYRRADTGRHSPDPERAQALAELTMTLEDLLVAAESLLGPKGALSVIYPAERLPELCVACQAHGLRPRRLRAVHPRQNVPARRVLLEARKGGTSALVWEPPLVLNGEDGRLTKEAAIILGEGPPDAGDPDPAGQRDG